MYGLQPDLGQDNDHPDPVVHATLRQESGLSLSQVSRCLSCSHLEVLLPHLAGAIVEDAEPVGGLPVVRPRVAAGTQPV